MEMHKLKLFNGPNNNTVTSTNKFLTVTQVAADAAVSTNTSIGITGTARWTSCILTAGRTRIRGLHGEFINSRIIWFLETLLLQEVFC